MGIVGCAIEYPSLSVEQISESEHMVDIQAGGGVENGNGGRSGNGIEGLVAGIG